MSHAHHGHDHSVGHTHDHADQTTAPVAWSMLAASGFERLVGGGALIALLWSAVWWALR